MGCRYYLPGEELGIECEQSAKLRAELDKLTRMLCQACGVLEDVFEAVPPGEVTDWWEQHKRDDAERWAAEQAAARSEGEQAAVRSWVEGEVR
jgi:hypothetical protein